MQLRRSIHGTYLRCANADKTSGMVPVRFEDDNIRSLRKCRHRYRHIIPNRFGLTPVEFCTT
jgi:hypothetical protein